MFVYIKEDNLRKFYLFKQADGNFNKINFFQVLEQLLHFSSWHVIISNLSSINIIWFIMTCYFLNSNK